MEEVKYERRPAEASFHMFRHDEQIFDAVRDFSQRYSFTCTHTHTHAHMAPLKCS